MSDFYSIKDPSFDVKHGRKYMCIDDWENIFIAEYNAVQDSFIIVIDNDEVVNKVGFILDDSHGDYVSDIEMASFNEDGVLSRSSYNPYIGNKLIKIVEFNLDIMGIK